MHWKSKHISCFWRIMMSEKIKDILLEHCGKKNAITSKQISKSMGFPMEDTQAVSRKEIWKTAEEYGLPVISCGNKGFCIAETDEEMKEFNENRDKRVAGIRKTQEMANRNYEEWKKKK